MIVSIKFEEDTYFWYIYTLYLKFSSFKSPYEDKIDKLYKNKAFPLSKDNVKFLSGYSFSGTSDNKSKRKFQRQRECKEILKQPI